MYSWRTKISSYRNAHSSSEMNSTWGGRAAAGCCGRSATHVHPPPAHPLSPSGPRRPPSSMKTGPAIDHRRSRCRRPPLQVVEGLAPRARTYHTHTPHTSRIISAAPPTAAPPPHAPYPQAHLAERVPVLVLVVLGEKDAEGCGEGMLGRVRGGRRARRRVVGPATAGRAAVGGGSPRRRPPSPYLRRGCGC